LTVDRLSLFSVGDAAPTAWFVTDELLLVPVVEVARETEERVVLWRFMSKRSTESRQPTIPVFSIRYIVMDTAKRREPTAKRALLFLERNIV
jgi:hypothetical protein